MSGKLVSLVILISALVAGVALYYLQVYGFYSDVTDEISEVRVVSLATGVPEPIDATDITAIDAGSSPIRFRACFSTSDDLEAMTTTFTTLPGVEPRNAPGWFECFDAPAIAAQLDAGTAVSFLGEKNVAFGVDRIIAITQDGRGFIWHELNDCGEKAYDGTIVGEECPPLPRTGS